MPPMKPMSWSQLVLNVFSLSARNEVVKNYDTAYKNITR